MSTSQDTRIWYDANCHCRRVQLRVRYSPLYASDDASIEPAPVINCNCSICTKNGYLNIYPEKPDDDIEWISGKDELKSYSFATGAVEHKFCPNCGSSIILVADTSQWGTKGGPDSAKWQNPEKIKVGVNVGYRSQFNWMHVLLIACRAGWSKALTSINLPS